MSTASNLSVSSIDACTAPDNFAVVTNRVYRSSFPKPENFAYLQKLGLKTILLVPTISAT